MTEQVRKQTLHGLLKVLVKLSHGKLESRQTQKPISGIMIQCPGKRQKVIYKWELFEVEEKRLLVAGILCTSIDILSCMLKKTNYNFLINLNSSCSSTFEKEFFS